jgi:5-methylcytosine-specific restriction endonuclease McrA
VFLPNELPLPEQSKDIAPIDIETVDFFKNREHIAALLSRERGQCFYCLREMTEDSCELDHVISQVSGGDNSYRNIVASCHQCNTKKSGNSAENHIRQLFRKGLLSEKEVEG